MQQRSRSACTLMIEAVSRRFVIGGLLGCFASTAKAIASVDADIRLGAIRWDAWYGSEEAPHSSEWFAAHDLDPQRYQYRAPFFAKRINNERLFISGTKQDVEAEIRYASNAGIAYWAFGWYPTGRPFHKAWEYYRDSDQRNLINWCVLIGLNSLAEEFPPHRELTRYFCEPEYEKVDGRPLLFVMHEKSDLDKAAKLLVQLRSACESANVASPYVVMQCAVPSLAVSEAERVGADAISAYVAAPSIMKGPISYQALDKSVREFWSQLAATGLPVVPNGMTGWDLRPRIEQRPPFDPLKRTMDQYVSPGSADEIGQHVAALLQFIRANPNICVARTGLIYSWNEFDEGGSALCPSWTERGPDTSILSAVSKRIKRH